jgi:acetyltransferase-like isoleucine patch superfamily enzyme
MVKFAIKWILRGASLAAAFLPAAASAFGAWENGYVLFAHIYSLIPGIPGDYLRIAFYKLTLTECDLSSRVSFGSFFAHPQVRLGAGVYIGCHCILGKAVIGERTQIASGVQILSGSRQHARNEAGEISGAEGGEFAVVEIGANCWIGAAAIVMASVGAGSTIGAGSVVTRPIPPDSVAVGSPARVLPRA